MSDHLDDIADDTVTHEERLTLVYITFNVAAFETYNYSCRMTNSLICAMYSEIIHIVFRICWNK